MLIIHRVTVGFRRCHCSHQRYCVTTLTQCVYHACTNGVTSAGLCNAAWQRGTLLLDTGCVTTRVVHQTSCLQYWSICAYSEAAQNLATCADGGRVGQLKETRPHMSNLTVTTADGLHWKAGCQYHLLETFRPTMMASV